MKRAVCFSLAMLMAHVLACAIGASAAERAEPETITIAGRTYTVVPDEEFRKLGFEFPDVALTENAATYYLKAFEAYVGVERYSKEDKLRDAVLKDRWTHESGALSAYLERNKEALELIEQAVAKDKCHFPILGRSGGSFEAVQIYAMPLPQLSRMRDLAKFVIAEGKAREFEGRVAEALDAYLLVLQMGNHAAQDPMLIASLVGVACNEMGMRAIEQCLLRLDVDKETLARVQERVHALSGGRPDAAAAMRSERALSTSVVEYFIHHPDRLDRIGVESVLTRAAFFAMLTSDKGPQQARRDVREFWDAVDKAMQMPLHEYIESGAGREPLEKARARKVPPNIVVLLGPTGRARGSFGRNELYWTVLDVEFALARYALQEGYYPESLDALEPFMLSDGIDPYSGKRLHYRLEPEGGFTIWSVGIDLTNDGGMPDPGRRSRRDQDDYIWNSAAIQGGN